MRIARVCLAVVLLALMAVSCTTAGGTAGQSTSPPGPCSEIPFDQSNGGFASEGVRVATITESVLCVDADTRTKFRITADSDIPIGLRAGDEIFLETLDGRVLRVELESQTTA